MREMADWLESVCGFRLQETERDLIQLRYAPKTGYKITFEEFAEQVAPVLKGEEEVEEEREEEDMDPDAVPMEEYEEEFNRKNTGGYDDRQREIVSGAEEEDSDVDAQMRGRRYGEDEAQ